MQFWKSEQNVTIIEERSASWRGKFVRFCKIGLDWIEIARKAKGCAIVQYHWIAFKNYIVGLLAITSVLDWNLLVELESKSWKAFLSKYFENRWILYLELVTKIDPSIYPAWRACGLRALGLLLVDGAPRVRRGKTFRRVNRFILRHFWPIWSNAWPKNNADKLPRWFFHYVSTKTFTDSCKN